MDIPYIVSELIRLHGNKQQTLADEIGVTQATVSRWLKGSEPEWPQREKLEALAKSAGLLRPEGARQAKPPSPSRFTPVPLISWVSAGKLADPGSQVDERAVERLAIADLGPGEFFALRVKGTSMDRYSPENSIVVVNRRERDLQEGKPYIFAVRGEVTYKIWRNSPARLAPYSTDPTNEPIFIDKKSSLIVIGRVRRSILEL